MGAGENEHRTNPALEVPGVGAGTARKAPRKGLAGLESSAYGVWSMERTASLLRTGLGLGVPVRE